MAHLIDKSALVAEIESYKNSFCDRNGYLEDRETNGLAYDTLCELEDSIDTLEVKEVDLEKEIREYLSTYWPNEKELHPFLGHMAKHFFELGLKAQKGEKV